MNLAVALWSELSNGCVIKCLFCLQLILFNPKSLDSLVDPTLIVELAGLMVELPDFVVGCFIKVAVEHLLHNCLTFHPGHVRYHVTSHKSQIL